MCKTILEVEYKFKYDFNFQTKKSNLFLFPLPPWGECCCRPNLSLWPGPVVLSPLLSFLGPDGLGESRGPASRGSPSLNPSCALNDQCARPYLLAPAPVHLPQASSLCFLLFSISIDTPPVRTWLRMMWLHHLSVAQQSLSATSS